MAEMMELADKHCKTPVLKLSRIQKMNTMRKDGKYKKEPNEIPAA